MKTYKLNNIEVSKQELQELIKNNPELLKENNKNWRAECNKVYYAISSNGEVYNQVEGVLQEDAFRYDTLNYFQTEEQAEAYKDYLLAVGRVSRAIWEANGDWEEDWNNDNERKWSIYYSYNCGTLEQYNTGNNKEMLVLPYIKSEEIAKQIIKDHEEDLMTIFNYKR